MPASGVVLMYLALSKFVATVYSNDDGMLNQILRGCAYALGERGMVTNARAETLLLSLLQVPLQICELHMLASFSAHYALQQAPECRLYLTKQHFA
jgi:hypothetical protein